MIQTSDSSGLWVRGEASENEASSSENADEEDRVVCVCLGGRLYPSDPLEIFHQLLTGTVWSSCSDRYF